MMNPKSFFKIAETWHRCCSCQVNSFVSRKSGNTKILTWHEQQLCQVSAILKKLFGFIIIIHSFIHSRLREGSRFATSSLNANAAGQVAPRGQVAHRGQVGPRWISPISGISRNSREKL